MLQVIVLRSGGQVESAGGWLRGAKRDPEGPSSLPKGSGCQPGRSTDHVEALAAGMRELEVGRKDQGNGHRGPKWTYPSFCKNECDKEMCLIFSLGVESLLLMLLCDVLDLCLLGDTER